MKDVMRLNSKMLTEDRKELINLVKEEGNKLYNLIEESFPINRERSLALTKLEEAVMWATKAITEARDEA